jgi:DNA repair protein RecN (Recombination protein N)
MLCHLRLKNLILIEQCEISFGKGLHILSGETGAGKTALIQAIGLAVGQKADESLIRKDAEQALVEAAFDLKSSPHVVKILNEAGIDTDPDEYLWIRRDLVRGGKNRAQINSKHVPLTLLQEIGAYLIEIVSQHSYQELKNTQSQRDLLDRFAGLEEELLLFQKAWAEEKALEDKLANLIERSNRSERERELIRFELKEIEEAAIQEEEEEKCLQEHKKQASAQELQDKTQLIHEGLIESQEALIPSLNRYKNLLQSLLKIDPSLQEPLDLFEQAQIHLKESAHFLDGYLSQIENDPNRLAFLEERLRIIGQIKRKYGNSLQVINLSKKQKEDTLAELENLENEIAQIKDQQHYAKEKSQYFAHILSQKRQLTAEKWGLQITEALCNLNMDNALFKIEIAAQPRSMYGDDLVTFWLRANIGEAFIPVKDSASGGELSRLLFAIKSTLLEKNKTPTIIIDEIDANVGGKTASLMGEKLHQLGEYLQVLCITHFPQVACHADHHYRIAKQELEGRTITTIEMLQDTEKQQELLRMLGGKSLSLNSPLV